MTPLTERYLAAALRGIPEKQRADVERELSSSIADAIEDRVAPARTAAAAEKAVLEGLGDPARLAAGMSVAPVPHRSGPVRRVPTAARDAAERRRADRRRRPGRGRDL